jgi:hypothetical protein
MEDVVAQTACRNQVCIVEHDLVQSLFERLGSDLAAQFAREYADYRLWRRKKKFNKLRMSHVTSIFGLSLILLDNS